jgi:hypothetical protein
VEQCADYRRCRQERKTHQQTRAEANDQYCVGGVLDVGLALDESLRQGAVHGLGQGTRSSPIRPRRRRPRGAEEPAYNERLNNCGSLGNDQADRGQRRSALEHTAQAGRGLGRFGSNYNEMFLDDISRVAVHQIKHDYIWSGSLQLLSIASTGVLGIKIILRRLWFIARGTKGRVANSIGN